MWLLSSMMAKGRTPEKAQFILIHGQMQNALASIFQYETRNILGKNKLKGLLFSNR